MRATVTAPFEDTLNVAAQRPAFVSRYRNLNLLTVGLQMISGLTQQIVELKQSLALAKAGADPSARAAAAADFQYETARRHRIHEYEFSLAAAGEKETGSMSEHKSRL